MESEIARLEAEGVEQNEQILMMLLAVIGSLIILWAYLENTIDAWVTVIHETGGAEDMQ